MKRGILFSAHVRREQGFTLIEIIVAMGLMPVLSLIMATMMNNSQKAVRAVANANDLNSQASLIASMLSSGNCGNSSIVQPDPTQTNQRFDDAAGIYPDYKSLWF